MQIQNGRFDLTYCTNIHPAEDWDTTFSNLVEYCLPLKQRLSPDAPFGIGLRLSNRAAIDLFKGEQLKQFREWLQRHQLYVFTLNGFPYGVFHQQPVKDNVYAPDWQATERVAYTTRLVQILAALLPDGMEGSISTLPLTYKPWLGAHRAAGDDACYNSCVHIAEVVLQLARVRQATGKHVHLNLEPEPDCLLEGSDDVIRFYNDWLLKTGKSLVATGLQCTASEAEKVLREHVQVCYDTCHFAVVYETAEEALGKLQSQGIGIGKMQISSALKVLLPADASARQTIAHRLQMFADPIYLHQVVAHRNNGSTRHYTDLDVALPHLFEANTTEWRIHFHVPVFAESFEVLSSTQAELVQTLHYLRERSICRHLEIETYTWSVLPESMRCGLMESIEREYAWVIGQLDGGFTPPDAQHHQRAVTYG